MQHSFLVRVALGLCTAAIPCPSTQAQSCTTTRISVGPAGVDVPCDKGAATITPDGRFVGFVSYGDGITANDLNAAIDVFVQDRQLGTTELASVSSSGQVGNANSEGLQVSDDGRIVAFWSYADNLVPGDTNQFPDVFVHDRQTGQTTRVSVDSNGVQGNDFSFLNGLSADGRWVLFSSLSDNLVAGDTGGFLDLFLHDRASGQTTCVSTDSAGLFGNESVNGAALSADGGWVVFVSMADNLVSGDTNGQEDCFLREVATGLVQRINLGPGGVEADESSGTPSISGNGRYATFESPSTTLVPNDLDYSNDTFVFDRQTGQLSLGSITPGGLHGGQGYSGGGISRDGRYLAFLTNDALEPGDTNDRVDIYVRDLWGTDFGRVVRSDLGQQVQLDCQSAVLSASPSVVAFVCADPGLVPGDSPLTNDVFVRDCAFPPTAVYTSTCIGTSTDCPCNNPSTAWGGCENSQGMGGAELAAHGRASLSADTLRLSAWRLPWGVPALFLQAPLAQPSTPWGDGLLCIGGGTNRLGIRFATTGGFGQQGIVQLGFGIAGDPSLAVSSNLPPTGGTRHYQLLYRNPDPAFCTAATFNLSNAIEVVWLP